MRRQTLVILAVALVPLLGFIIFSDVSSRHDRDLAVRANALLEAENAASEMAQLFEGARQLLDTLATSPSVRQGDWDACKEHLQRLISLYPQYVSLSVLSPTGDVVCRHQEVEGRPNFSDRSYFKEALAKPKSLILSEMIVSRISGNSVLPLSMGYANDAGAVQGVLVASLDVRWLAGVVAKRRIPEGASLTIADRTGTILARQPAQEQFFGTKIPERYMRLVNADEPGVEEVVSLDGTQRYLGYIPVKVDPVGLYVSAGLSSQLAFADLNAGSIRTWLTAALAGLFAALVAAIMAASIGAKAKSAKPNDPDV